MSELTDRVITWRDRGEETGFDGHRFHFFKRQGRGPTRRAGLDPVAEAAVWAEVAGEAVRWGYSPA